MGSLLAAVRPHLRLESSLSYVLTRYASAVLFAVEALALARLLGPDGYGKYALLPQIAVLLLFTTLGSNAGYVYAYYKSGDPDLDRQYLVGATTQFLVGGLICTALLAVVRPFLAVGALIYLIQMPYWLTEPMLRVRNRFSMVALGRTISVFLTMLLVAVWIVSPRSLTLTAAISFLVIGNAVGYVTYYVLLYRSNVLDVKFKQLAEDARQPAIWSGYWRNVMRPGIPLNASSIILFVFTSVDRLFIEYYRSAMALSVYSFAWQLSQGVLLMLTSMNMVSGIRVGEWMTANASGLKRELGRRFRLTAAIGFVAYLALAGAAMVLSRTFYADYENLVLIVLLLSSGYVVMNVVGSVTGVLSFERRTTELNVGYGAALVATIIGNFIAVRYDLWYGVPIAISSLCLIVLNIWFALHTRKLTERLHLRSQAVPVSL